MSDNKPEKGQQAKDDRLPAEQLLLDFLRLHKITLIVDRINQIDENIKEVIYTVNERIRVRAIYSDQVKKEPKSTNGNSEKVDVVA